MSAADKVRVVKASKPRVNLRIPWRDSTWLSSSSSTTSPPPRAEIQALSPGSVLRKVALLYQKRNLDEIVCILESLSPVTLSTLATELPMDVFMEDFPQTLPILRIFYVKLAELDVFPISLPDVITLLLHLAVFASEQNMTYTPAGGQWLLAAHQTRHLHRCCNDIIGIATRVYPEVRNRLLAKKEQVAACLRGLGEHGMVTYEDSLMHLSDCLLTECNRSLTVLKSTMTALDEMKLPEKSHHDRKHASSTCGHQRLLSLNVRDIQDRLIRNKSLMNAVDRTAASKSQLAHFVHLLSERIEADKEALRTTTELRKQLHVLKLDDKVGRLLATLSRGLDMILKVNTAQSSPDGQTGGDCGGTDRQHLRGGAAVDSSHTDGQAAELSADVIIQEEPLPGIVHKRKLAMESTSQQSVSNTTNVPPAEARNNELTALREQYAKAKATILHLQQRERNLLDKLTTQAKRQIQRGCKFEDISLTAHPTQLVRRYETLYTQSRVDALDSMDAILRRDGFYVQDNLKNKIAFTVMLLSYRCAEERLSELRSTVFRLLPVPEGAASPQQKASAAELNGCINNYLCTAADSWDTAACYQDVVGKLCECLKEFSALQESNSVTSYIRECVQLSWALCVQTPPLTLHYSDNVFNPGLHERFHSSDPGSDKIRDFLWPALMEEKTCLHKGVIMTGEEEHRL
ncbi:Hypp2196 [Branchiostoma lanceolatum]|uniref:Mitochondria-eating protein n=1 Tax=Branchiostoma lanceolatum TaxID=7740 RepID=A0A8J9ZPC2_BRALA|nr:Hypp2196 [Branchiostoma lanceolatum]